MRFSGPVQADIFEVFNKKCLFLSDCHQIGNGCSDPEELSRQIFDILKDKSSSAIIVESSLDIFSDRVNLDLVKFTRQSDQLKKSFPNITIYHTDIRRYSTNDIFWLDDLLKEIQVSTFDDVLSAVKDLDIPQAKLLYNSAFDLSLSEQCYFIRKVEKYLSSVTSDYAPVECSGFLMDMYTYSLIKKLPQKNIVYYAGMYHIENLIRSFKVKNHQTFGSTFKDYCDLNACYTSDISLKESLSLPQSRCVQLNINLKNFFK